MLPPHIIPHWVAFQKEKGKFTQQLKILLNLYDIIHWLSPVMKCKCHFHEGFVPLAGPEEKDSSILQSLRNFNHVFYIYVYIHTHTHTHTHTYAWGVCVCFQHHGCYSSINLFFYSSPELDSNSSSVPNWLWLALSPSGIPQFFHLELRIKPNFTTSSRKTKDNGCNHTQWSWCTIMSNQCTWRKQKPRSYRQLTIKRSVDTLKAKVLNSTGRVKQHSEEERDFRNGASCIRYKLSWIMQGSPKQSQHFIEHLFLRALFKYFI